MEFKLLSLVAELNGIGNGMSTLLQTLVLV